jgi:lysophospholipase L1-like esterase
MQNMSDCVSRIVGYFARTFFIRTTLLVVFLAISIVALTMASRATPSPFLWQTSNSLTYSVLSQSLNSQTPRPSSCLDMTVGALTSDPIPTQYPLTSCFSRLSSGGIISSQYPGFMRLGSVGSVSRIAPIGNARWLISAGSRIIVQDRKPLGYSTFSVYDSPETAFTYSLYNHQYVLTSGPDWTIADPASTDPVNHPYVESRHIAVSQNGQWAIIAGGGKAVWRVNLDTHQAEAIASPIGSYGYGFDPSYNLAISDDGRYGAIAGTWAGYGGSRYSDFNLYDLNDCSPVDIGGGRMITICNSRDLKPYVTDNEPSYNDNGGVYGMRFSPDGDSLNFYLHTTEVKSGDDTFNTSKYASIKTPSALTHGLDYLALGDSFSSGEGDAGHYEAGTDGDADPNLPENLGVNTAAEKCHLSVNSYPYRLASLYNIAKSAHGDSGFRSVACSGAVSGDVTEAENNKYEGQHESLKQIDESLRQPIKNKAIATFTPGREAQKAFLRRYKPKSATISIGGNDVHFSDILKNCLSPTTGTCYAEGNDRRALGQSVHNEYSKIDKVLKEMHEASENTKIYVVGYPQLLLLGSSCSANVGLEQPEIEMSHYVVNYLNKIIKTAAEHNGMKYIDIENALVSHGLCSTDDEIAVNAIMPGNDQVFIGVGWFGLNVIGNETFHPNSYGHSLMTGAIADQIGNLSTQISCNALDPNGYKTFCSETAETANVPNIPTYFGTSEVATPVISNWGIAQFMTSVDDGIYQGVIDTANNLIIKPAQAVASAASGAANAVVNVHSNMIISINPNIMLAPSSVISSELHSSPISLGQIQVDSSGHVTNQTISLPDNLPTGYHTLHLYATLITGEQIDMQEQVLVADWGELHKIEPAQDDVNNADNGNKASEVGSNYAGATNILQAKLDGNLQGRNNTTVSSNDVKKLQDQGSDELTDTVTSQDLEKKGNTSITLKSNSTDKNSAKNKIELMDDYGWLWWTIIISGMILLVIVLLIVLRYIYGKDKK